MFAPLTVEHGENHTAFQLVQRLVAELLAQFHIGFLGGINDELAQSLGGLVALETTHSLLGFVLINRDGHDLGQRLEQAVPIPILRFGGSTVCATDVAGDGLVNEAQDVLVDVLALEHGLALGVDDLALLVHHVVILEDVLTDFEVA